MKYICLGYINEKEWESATQEEQQAMMDECFTYDDVLQEGGHFAGGEALASPSQARTVRAVGSRVSVTDGPFAETKEILGGLLFLEADDLEHAVALISRHPGARVGCFEIRPLEDLTEMVRQSRERRAVRAG